MDKENTVLIQNVYEMYMKNVVKTQEGTILTKKKDINKKRSHFCMYSKSVKIM